MDAGSLIWVSDPKEGWALGTVNGRNGKDINVRAKGSGEELIRKAEECYSALASEPGSLRGINDLTRLPALHEPALLQALQERYESDQIYTSVGPILIAVNPFRKVPGLYDSTTKWINQQRDLPPHVYGLADASFRSMVDHKGCNQSILVSGESGAGKTETTKHAMQYLTEVSGGGGADVSSKILSANPLLEAFGNAKTVRNDNSSRFGKLIEMKFADSGRHKLIGAGVTSYLLEKARVVHQARGERNYHIFYELFAGATSAQKEKWKLDCPQNHYYLTSSGEFSRADVPDTDQFEKTMKAMTTMGFSQQDCDEVFRIVAGVLHLGNVDFEERQGGEACAVTNVKALDAAAEMFGLEAGRSTDSSLSNPSKTLADVLCVRKIVVQGVGDAQGQGETYVKPLSIQFAREAKDALAMAIYERLFNWIVWRVNHSMEWQQHASGSGGGAEQQFAKGSEKLRHQFRIGVLDIFGFEVFEENYFEQLCINYANEQLQRQFNEHVFELEQKMYEAEGVDWTFVQFPDNSATITMIESKPIGLLSLIDEECMYPSGGDKSLAAKLYQNLIGKSDRFSAPHAQQRDYLFTVKHFAGDVTYTVDGFYRKNKNELRQDAVDLICGSKQFLLRVLLPPDAQEAAGGADAAQYFEKRAKQLGLEVLAAPGSQSAKEWESKALPLLEKSTADSQSSHSRSKSSGRRSQLQQTTVSSHFKTQLHSALSLIRASKPHYVRCLKPNDKNRPNIFTRPRVLNQLRYSGVVEVIKVARAGYPTRFDVPDFVERYAVLISVKASKEKNAGLLEAKRILNSNDQKLIHSCATQICLMSSGLEQNRDFQVGKTKVFLRADAMTKLELAKSNKIKGAVRMIQKTWRKYYKTHRYDRAARKVQRRVRGYLARKRTKTELKRRRAAADYIHSSPNFRRWLEYIRENLKIKYQVEAEMYEKQSSGETDIKTRLIWWYVIPLAVLAGVPRFLRQLYYSHPNLLILLMLAITGTSFGSVLMLEAQRRGVLPKGAAFSAQRKARGASAADAALKNKRKKASAVLFADDHQKHSRKTSVASRGSISSTSNTRKESIYSRRASSAASAKRFGGIAKPTSSPPNSPVVQINVNAQAVKRFAGLAARRQDAMERAKRKAEDMFRTGELQSAIKRGSGHFQEVMAQAIADSNKQSSDETKEEDVGAGKMMQQHPSISPRSSASTATIVSVSSPTETARRSSLLSIGRGAECQDGNNNNNARRSSLLPFTTGMRRTSTTTTAAVPTNSRSSGLESAMPQRRSSLNDNQTSPKGSTLQQESRGSLLQATIAARRSSVPPPPAAVQSSSSKTPPPLPPGKPRPQEQQNRVGVSSRGHSRAESGLNDDEQYMLNKAILAMFLEEQAPDRLDMTDDLLKEFKGKEELLFDKLTNEFPDADALHLSGSSSTSKEEEKETPVWSTFKQRRKHRQSQKGFFGTASPGSFPDDDDVFSQADLKGVRVVTEKTSSGAKKNRFSIATKKLETGSKSLFTKITGGH